MARALYGVLLTILLPYVVLGYNNGVGRLPIMGWSSWCTDDACGARDICTEKEVKSVVDGIVAQGLDKLGYRYIALDDCWSDHDRNTTGQLQPNPQHFPSGMKALADYIHERGLYLGLYTCVGTKTCRNDRPGSYGNYKLDAETLAGWGVDLVKADNCHRPSNITEQEAYGNFSAALNSTGKPIVFSLCEWGDDNVQDWGGTVGQMWRVQEDHLPFWHFPSTAAGKGFGQGTYDIIEYVATLNPSQFTGPYNYMDPDFLETLFPITMDFFSSRTEFTFWCLWSSPLLVATDMRNLGPQKQSIITNQEVIAIDQDPAGRAGDRIFNQTNGAQVWRKELGNGDLAVVFYNSKSKTPLNISVTWQELSLQPQQPMKLRDLWTKTTLNGTFTANFTATNISHKDVMLLRLSKA